MTIQKLAEHLGSARCVGCALVGGILCGDCRAAVAPALDPPRVKHIERVIAAWDYDASARSLVLALKVSGRREAATELGGALVERVWGVGVAVDVLTWIPARDRDLRARGFDHAELIARVVSRSMGLPLVSALRRTGPRLDQSGLNADQRKVNQVGAFAARHVGRRVGVIDDLMTTGATLSDAGRALRETGAMRVEGLVSCFVA